MPRKAKAPDSTILAGGQRDRFGVLRPENGKHSAFRGVSNEYQRARNRPSSSEVRIMSDDDLWWLFLHHREECSHEFWEELESRKDASTLSKDSPLWTVRNVARCLHAQGPADNSNLIELTREEWEARRRRKMFRITVLQTGTSRRISDTQPDQNPLALSELVKSRIHT
jgi:hypothetical protein